MELYEMRDSKDNSKNWIDLIVMMEGRIYIVFQSYNIFQLNPQYYLQCNMNFMIYDQFRKFT